MQCFTYGLKCAILGSNSKLQYKNILLAGLIEPLKHKIKLSNMMLKIQLPSHSISHKGQ